MASDPRGAGPSSSSPASPPSSRSPSSLGAKAPSHCDALAEGEFDFIRQHLAPLSAAAPGAYGLTDDAAELAATALAVTGGVVVTADLLTEGVHFLADDPLDRVAQKALRVNLSDLAAKGATPLHYLLSVAWPERVDAAGRALFVDGLAADQAAFGVSLLGGDTTRAAGPLTVAVTAIGTLEHAAMVRRAGAQPGDQVCVTGTIGDGGLGLLARRGALAALGASAEAALRDRYQRPQPRVAAIAPLRAFATAGMDISDGLIADAHQLARASGVVIRLEAARVPVSEAAQAWLARQDDEEAARAWLAAAGDDYELLVCVSPARVADARAAFAAAGVPLTVVGAVGAGGPAVEFVNHKNENIPMARRGYTHF